jgi:hypothetical protein
MAKQRKRVEMPDRAVALAVPPPVEDGTDHFESLGLIDKVVGNLRIEKQALEEVLTLSSPEAPDSPQPDTGSTVDSETNIEPLPVEIPPPVEEGTDYDTREAEPPRTKS